MKHKAFWLGTATGIALVAAVLVVTLSTTLGRATAQPEQVDVSEALRQTLTSAGVPVQDITSYSEESVSAGYLVVCKSTGAGDPVNAAVALQQAAVLANKGIAIDALRVQCIDASRQIVLDMAKPVDATQVRLGELATTGALSALQSALDRALAGVVPSPAVERRTLAVDQDAGGLVTVRLSFGVSDMTTAKKVLDQSLIQKVVESCVELSTKAEPAINTVIVAVVGGNGEILLNYFQNLDTGSITAYHAPEIGMGWTTIHGVSERN